MKPLPARINRYEVREQIGQGGMGVLYLALDPAIDRLVAVKVLRIDNDEVHERFIREAKSAGRLQHPNIITIYDVGEHEGQPFIAMEYIAGETLGEIIKRRSPLTMARKLELLGDLCLGLHFAHRANIVHRDVKPSNVMVNRDGLLKVLDFGIARLADSSHTQIGVLMGTPNYMAPEQTENARVDHRADIFALGAVAYELITYRQAFQGSNATAVLNALLHTEPPPMDTLVSPLDPEIVRIVTRALAKQASARYQDLATMGAELAAVRARLGDAANEATVILPSPAGTAARTPSWRTTREDLLRRRLLQVDGHLDRARTAMVAGDLEAALAAAHDAALLDPDHAPTTDLLASLRMRVEEASAADLLDRAERALASGSLTEAAGLVRDATTLVSSPRAEALHARVASAFEEREQERERRQQHARALDDARTNLQAGALESAIRSADAALAYQAGSPEALEIKSKATELIAERQRHEAADRAADEFVASARAQFDRGEREEAIRRLADYSPAHPRVVIAQQALVREDEARRVAEREQVEGARAEDTLQVAEGRERAERVDQQARDVAEPPGERTIIKQTADSPTIVRHEASAAGPIRVLDHAKERLSESPGLEVPLWRRPLVVVAGAATVFAGVALAFFLSGRPETDDPILSTGKTPIPTSTPTPTSTSTPAPKPPVDELLAQSRNALAAGRIDEAISLASQARERRPDLAEPTDTLQNAVSAALDAANDARKAASKAGADRRQEFITARGVEQSAARIRAEDPAQAGRRYLEAQTGYRQALDAESKAAADRALKEQTLAVWVTSQLAQAHSMSGQNRFEDAGRILREISERAPATPGIGTLMAEAQKGLAAQQLQTWALRQLAEADRAITGKQFDDAERLLGEVKQKAPATPGVDAARTRLDKARLDAKPTPAPTPTNAPATPTPTPNVGGGASRGGGTAAKNETEAVKARVREYAEAYSRMDLVTMKRFWPTMPPSASKSYQEMFDDNKTVNWRLDEVYVSFEGDAAVAFCTVTPTFQGKKERQPRALPQQTYRIDLVHAKGDWTISKLALKSLK